MVVLKGEGGVHGLCQLQTGGNVGTDGDVELLAGTRQLHGNEFSTSISKVSMGRVVELEQFSNSRGGLVPGCLLDVGEFGPLTGSTQGAPSNGLTTHRGLDHRFEAGHQAGLRQ